MDGTDQKADESSERTYVMMEWLTSQNPVPEEGQEGYRIHQKQMDSRRVWMTETPEACRVEDFYRQTGELMAEEMTDFGKMRGYLLDECDFMKHRQLSIEGSLLRMRNHSQQETIVCQFCRRGITSA